MQINFETVTTGIRHVSQCYEAIYYSNKSLDIWAKVALGIVALADVALSLSDFRKYKEPIKWGLFAARLAVIVQLEARGAEKITKQEQSIMLTRAIFTWAIDTFAIKNLSTQRCLDAWTGVELCVRSSFLRYAR